MITKKAEELFKDVLVDFKISIFTDLKKSEIIEKLSELRKRAEEFEAQTKLRHLKCNDATLRDTVIKNFIKISTNADLTDHKIIAGTTWADLKRGNGMDDDYINHKLSQEE